MRKEINVNKPALIAGIIILIICLCIVFPIEYRTASFLSDLKYTFFSLALAMLTLMYSLMGKHFFKVLLFLLFSIICGIACWFLLFPLPDIAEPSSKTLELFIFFISAFANLSSIVMGTVTGVIAGLIFLAVNFWFLHDENRYKLLAKRLLVYLSIVLLVALVCHEGGDWIYNVTEYFKNGK